MSIDIMNSKVKELRELRRMADELAGEAEHGHAERHGLEDHLENRDEQTVGQQGAEGRNARCGGAVYQGERQ